MLKRTTTLVTLSLTVIIIVAIVTVHTLTLRPFTPALAVASGEYVYYFAYGSNMPARYLTNVRHVAVYDSAPGRLIDHDVQFFVSGLPFLEPAFANLIPAKGRSAFGVLHRIDANSLFRISCSESESYAMAERDVQRLDSSATVRAWTLVGSPSVATAVPSRRYLGLLLEGAEAHDLPLQYSDRLAQAQLDGAYTPVLSELFAAVIYARVMLQAAKFGNKCGTRPG